MILGCKNCGGFYTGLEMAQRKPPLYPWKLTEVGARVLAENLAGGEQRPCPNCGQRTLVSKSAVLTPGEPR